MSKPRTPWGEAMADWRPPGETPPRTARETMIDHLAAIIREVDGNHRLGAAALAEAIVDRLVTGGPPVTR